MNKNLKLAVPLSFMSMIFFPSATWMFFMLQYLNFQEIATIMGIGAIASIVMEIPTGVFADMVGRKWAIALSYFLFTVAMIWMTVATSYTAFLLITLVNCLVNTLYSGSMEALLYDTLKQDKKEGEFDHWTSRMESVTWLGLFLSTVAGGYLHMMSPNYPYLVQAVVMGIATMLSLMLIEPRIDSVKYKIGDVWKNNFLGFKELFATSKMGYLTAIFVVIGVGYVVAADILGISQAREYGLDAQTVGWVFGVGYVISALASHFYPKLRKMTGSMRLVWGSTFILIVSFVLAKYVGAWAGVGLIVLRIASSTTFRNSRSVLINSEIGSANRATTLSTLTLLTNIPYALSAIWIGGYIDRTSPNQFAWMLGLGIMVMLIMILLFTNRKSYLISSAAP